MDLIHLLADITTVKSVQNRKITGLCLDSRRVQAGDLFIAYCGGQFDGRDYIAEAIAKGAAAILAEARDFAVATQASEVPIFTVKGLDQQISRLAARYYDYPSRHMRVIGITGTNGKTSCSQFIASALQAAQQSCAVIGTLGYGFPAQLHEADLTTPDPVTIQRLLADVYQQEARFVTMETSSHALAQGRVNDVTFAAGIFTNLSQDHLDYHGDMHHYGRAKQRLFTQFNLPYAVINVDDAFGCQLIKQLPKKTKSVSYGLDHHNADVTATNVKLTNTGMQADINTPWGRGILESPLIGRFNLSNLLAVLATLNIVGIDFDSSLQLIKNLTEPPGRLQMFKQPGKPLVVVDFAHTPDALATVLQTLQEIKSGDIWCVFGCGGDRDKTKRPLMGAKAKALADHLVITNDNPRYEDPQVIIQDIIAGISDAGEVTIERDRAKAIEHALSRAQVNDIVLIAGKGHERYQSVRGQKIPMQDAELVQTLLGI